MKNILLTLCIACVALSGTAFADEAKFQAQLDRDTIAIGETAQLGLTFYGTQSMPAPDIDRVDGLEIRYLGPSTMMTVLNGQVSSSITHMYSVQPLRTGAFQLGPFKFQQKNMSYVSNIAYLTVGEERAPTAPKRPEQVVEKIDLGDRMFLTLETDRLTGYVNELIPVTVKLFVNRMNVSDIQLPVFEQEEFSKVAFKEPKQYRKSIGGVLYDILEFNTSIFGTKPGGYALGPAKLKCNAMIRRKLPRGGSPRDDFFGDEFGPDSFFDDFYTRYERHPIELKSQQLNLVIQALPAEGRPKNFSGSVGDYQFIVNATPTKLKAGDPITLNMSVNGRGNFNTVIMPNAESIKGFRVYEPQIKTGENTKELKQVLIPETDRVTEIPAFTFTFFDPYKKQYRSLTQGPIPLVVEKGKDDAPAQVVGPLPGPATSDADNEEPVRDIISIKEAPGRWLKKGEDLYRSPVVGAGFVIPVVLLIVLGCVQGRRNRLRQDSVYAGRIAAFRIHKRAAKHLRRYSKAGDRKALYEQLFKTMQDYLGNRFAVPPAGITYDVIAGILEPKNVDLEELRKLRNLFIACDRAKFAQSEADELMIEDDLKNLKEVIAYFERTKL